jgi:repressor LexA
MDPLTRRQEEILNFIKETQSQQGITPSLREIAAHFRFRSMTAAMDHVRALRKKGALESSSKTRRRARDLQPFSPLQAFRSATVDIPVFGEIPAGPPQDRLQEAKGCISVDLKTLGIPRANARTFALQVRGDSMVGRHIVDGDYVVLEHGLTPRNGDVVAALIDNESTLKTFILERGKPWLKAENPRYPKLIPAIELVIQGVMVGLFRKYKN